MDLAGVPTPSMDWSSVNLLEAFKKFCHHAELIFAGALRDKDPEVHCTYLLLWVGEKGREIYNTLTLTNDQKKDVSEICSAFQTHVQPKSNPVFARYKFNTEVQGDNSVEQFITRLKVLSKDCSFDATYVNDMIRDQMVFGIKSQDMRKKLLTVGADLTLDKAIQVCQTNEYAQEQLKTMTTIGSSMGAATAAVNYVHQRRQGSSQSMKSKGSRPRGPASGSHMKSNSAKTMSTGETGLKLCSSCGKKHAKDRCPAMGKQCHNCKKWNHFSACCRSKNVNNVEVSKDYSDNELFIDSVESRINNGQVFAEMEVDPSKQGITFKVDTGSQVNILPYYAFQQLGLKTALNPSHTKLSAYDGNPLHSKGTITLQCTHQGLNRTGLVEFHVVDTHSTPLLGLQSCIEFDLVKITYAVETKQPQDHMTKNSVLKDYTHAFKGLGSIPGECKIHLKSDAIPVVHPPRKIPVALKDRCKAELDRMEKMGVIQKVHEPTDWVNSMVLVEKKSGKLRICLDPHGLNKCVQRPHYPVKTLDDVLPLLNGAKFFTKLDTTSSYWNVKLSDQSSYLTTFNTCFGRYRYLRLPFGLICSMDIFQQKMVESFENLPGVVVIVDDILVFGKTREEHDFNLRAALQRALDKGIRLNEEKLEVGLVEISYFGHVLSADGLRPDPMKISAIKDMPPPENRSELETWFGMVNYQILP